MCRSCPPLYVLFAIFEVSICDRVACYPVFLKTVQSSEFGCHRNREQDSDCAARKFVGRSESRGFKEQTPRGNVGVSWADGFMDGVSQFILQFLALYRFHGPNGIHFLDVVNVMAKTQENDKPGKSTKNT